MDAAAQASSPRSSHSRSQTPPSLARRHSSADWITTIAYGLIAVAGLLLATRVILGARNNETRAAQLAA